jgi:hypothetical protein
MRVSKRFVCPAPRGDDVRNLLEADAKFVWACEASSNFDAMTKYYEYMGWGEYTTDFPEHDKKTYAELRWV